MAGFTKIRIMEEEEADEVYKRQGSNVDKLDEYIDTLRRMSLGQALSVKVSEETVTTTKGGVTTSKIAEIVPDTIDDNGEADTVRMFKRRMNAAAETLNFSLNWKVKGHREPDEAGESRFVTDWLIGRAEKSKVKVTKDGQNGQ